GRNRYSRALAAAFPELSHRRGPRFHTRKSRRRGDLAPHRGRLCEPTRPSALLRVLFSAGIKAIDQVAKPVWNALVHDFVVHGAQLLAQTGLYISAEFGRFIDPFVACRRRFHPILLSHGLSFVHCFTPQVPRPGRAPVPPWFCAKPLT